MGRRSDVAIMVDEKHAENFGRILIENDMLTKASRTDKTDNGVTGVYFESIKWERNEYPEIESIISFLDGLEFSEYGVIEIDGSSDGQYLYGSPHNFDLYVNMTIDMPF